MLSAKRYFILKYYLYVPIVIFIVGLLLPDWETQNLFYMLLPGAIYGLYFPQINSWFFYGPLTVMVAGWMPFFRYLIDSKMYFGLCAMIVIGIIIKLINYLMTPKKLAPYYREISESKLQISTVTFNEKAFDDNKMSEADREFFKTEIKKHHEEFEYLSKIDNDIKQMIPKYNLDMKIINGIFSELLDSPKSLLTASDFLYKDLPDYVKVVKGIEGISNNTVKDPDDKATLKTAKAKLVILSGNLQNDFKKVTAAERDALKKQLDQIETNQD